MSAKTTTVILEVPGVGTQEFGFEHAEELLKMPRNGGWILPKDSPFELTENGLKYRENTEKDSGKQKRAGFGKSEGSSEQD